MTTPSSAEFHQPEPHAPIPAPRFRWWTRVGLPAALVLALGGLFAGSMVSSMTPAATVDVAPVVERPAIRSNAELNPERRESVAVQAAGWIEPAPFPVYATALAEGTVQEVLFLEGQAVKKGDVLVRLNDADARLALRRAEAEARAAEEAWETNVEGRRQVAVTAEAAREASAALALARSELEAERAQLVEARRVMARRKQLAASGGVSRAQYEAAETAARTQEARVRAGEQRIKELESKLKRAGTDRDAAERQLQLRTEERRQLDVARIALEEAQLRAARMEIRAPMDGVVMRRLVEPGSQVLTGSENPAMARVAELYDPSRLQVRVDVPLADAAKVGVSQPAQVVVEVLPDRPFKGTVTRLTNLADIQKNTLQVKVGLTAPAPELKPEMLARVRFLAVQDESSTSAAAGGALAVFAPKAAIVDGSAWVVSNFDGESGVAVKRSVTLTGAGAQQWQEVATGLNPGDLLIVSSTRSLKPGQRVRVRPERRNP